MIEELKAHLGAKQTAIIEMAIRCFYRKEIENRKSKKSG